MKYAANIHYEENIYDSYYSGSTKIKADTYAELVNKIRGFSFEANLHTWDLVAVHCNETSKFSDKALNMLWGDVRA